jgi:hypothetical protein
VVSRLLVPVPVLVCVGAALLSGCQRPLLVPDAGPHAPGFAAASPPVPPEVVLATGAAASQRATGGVIDAVKVADGVLVITGWAMLPMLPMLPSSPPGRLAVSFPAAATSRIIDVVVVPRPDVIAATSQADLLYSGFEVSIDLRGAVASARVCVQSSSPAGVFRLAGSDETLCRADPQ